MYLGALIMIFGIPLALGSWWGLATNRIERAVMSAFAKITA
jgi:protein-S-isoprenylcysteine O-methyltransferase Ste14